MSKLESLWETDQYFTYKDKKIRVRFLEEYFDSVPRLIVDERKLLKEDIHIRGLDESIKINPQGQVLDGHTRIEICEEINWKTIDEKPIKPKFEVKEFSTKQEEREYVIKTNLMRRQLNAFQKVRLISKLYNNNPHSRKEQTRYDVLLELKKGKLMSSKMIGGIIGMHKANVLKVLKGLKEDYCANFKTEIEGSNKTARAVHYYYILPKGEGILYKGRPEAVTLKKLGRSIGVARDHVSRAIFLLDHANSYTLGKLERGDIGIMTAYLEIIKPEKEDHKVTSYSYLRGDTQVKCIHCGKTSMKKEWTLIKRGRKQS